MGLNRSNLLQFLRDVGVGKVYYDREEESDNQGFSLVLVKKLIKPQLF